ncbi:MAG: hypothetical protein IID39_01800 [Planctomycetes bacterium]|nr:hypothetical protein [Planctomycetota bacterium]
MPEGVTFGRLSFTVCIAMALRVGILTGNDLRHRYFVNAVAAHFDVVAVGCQNVAYQPEDAARRPTNARTTEILRHHFDERRRQEDSFFGHQADFRDSTERCVRSLDPDSLNGMETVQFLENRRVDVVLIYGTDLIKPPLLDRFAGCTINMHLGLSPYYRGTATNFSPLVNDEPEYVGATILLLDPGIDSGPIIHHARPDIVAEDLPHTVGCKAILAGIEKVIQALGEFETGELATVPQWKPPDAKLYLRKDYHPSQVVKLYELIEAGLFPNYVARKKTVQDAFRLIP